MGSMKPVGYDLAMEIFKKAQRGTEVEILAARLVSDLHEAYRQNVKRSDQDADPADGIQ